MTISIETALCCLVISPTAHREFKPNPPPRQLPIHLRISIQSVIHTAPLLLIQNHLHHLRPILLGPHALPDDLDRVHDVRENGVVDGGQGARAGPLLRLRGARAAASFGAREDAARGQEDDVLGGEFLFELAGKAVGGFLVGGSWVVKELGRAPLLGAM